MFKRDRSSRLKWKNVTQQYVRIICQQRVNRERIIAGKKQRKNQRRLCTDRSGDVLSTVVESSLSIVLDLVPIRKTETRESRVSRPDNILYSPLFAPPSTVHSSLSVVSFAAEL